MNPDIIIPTFRTPEEVSPLVCDVEGFSWGCRIIATCRPGSAALNRNAGLAQATTPLVIMIDDDTAGFYEGWWKDLIQPLEEDPNIVMVSARLLKADGSIGQMMFLGNLGADYLTDVPRCATACIAFRNDGLRFDEKFEGSGFEDDDFCAQQFKKYPNAKTVINNRCRIIHINEMKNQRGAWWEKNKAYFDSKWLTTGGGSIRVPVNKKIAYHSEYGEDEWLNDHIFMGSRGGTFFGAGAMDGIDHSNTLFYEEALGWTGLLVEANPDEYAKCVQNRKCAVVCAALWNRSGQRLKFKKIETGLRGWSGVSKAIESQHADRIRDNVPAGKIKTIDVPSVKLETLLRKHNLNKIDLFSLDVEGAEYTILKDFPFSKFDIRVFVIEDNFNNYPITDLILKNGYKMVVRLGVSNIYIKENFVMNENVEIKKTEPEPQLSAVEKTARLNELLTTPRVPLPPDVADDDHNRVGGLIEMIRELFPANARIVELGTGQGVSTEVFALLCGEVLTTDTMIDTDPWRAFAKQVFARYDNIKHFNMTAARLAAIMPDRSFDAVYIDTLHTYEACLYDIKNWLPKLKPGGIMCGHDHIDRPAHNFGVIRAVKEMFGAPEKLYKDTSWAVRIPK